MFASHNNTRRVLDDRTHRTLQETNRVNVFADDHLQNTVVSIKTNNPYLISVIPQDPHTEMEQRLLRQQTLKKQQQQGQWSQPSYNPVTAPQPLQVVSDAGSTMSPLYGGRPQNEYMGVGVSAPFAGFLSEREHELSTTSPLHHSAASVVPFSSGKPSSLLHRKSAPAPLQEESLAALPPPSQLTKFYSNGRPMVAFTPQAPHTPIDTPPASLAASVTSVPKSQVAAAAPQVVPPAFAPATSAVITADERQLRSLVATVQKRREREECYVISAKETFPDATGRSQILNRYVMLEGDRGKDIGVIVAVRNADSGDRIKLSKVLHLATDADVMYYTQDLVRDEEHARAYCQHQVERLLPDNEFVVVDAVFQFDKEKLTFWYRVPQRCYFVPLLKALNQQYRCRIWMERILKEDETDE